MTFFEGFTKFVFGFGLLICAIIWNTFCVMHVWNWLATAILRLPSVTMAGAYGIGILIAMFRSMSGTQSTYEEYKKGDPIFMPFITKLFGQSIDFAFVLLLAYVVKGWL